MIEDFNSKEKIYLYLKSHHIAALSTASEEKRPHGALVYVFADPDLNFYFFTKSKTKKAEDLENNNQAALTVFDPTFPRTIQAEGTVQKIVDEALYDKLFNFLMSQTAKEEEGLYWPPPISKVYIAGELTLFKFEPKWLRFADFSDSKTFLHVNLENNFFQVIPPQEQ
ncbi:pyridoxamine 5'-phosphate oxidase family protein [Candidatus Roizmanbacteria bacterium]|nr:pyridoxamine 5'-phosphate oxidase family protein [Candidatus Roizmanbacteria bacterium]